MSMSHLNAVNGLPGVVNGQTAYRDERLER